MKAVVDLIGRIFLSFIFIYEGIDSILYFGKTKDLMTEYGINFQQDVLLVGSIVLLMLGGILLLIGYRSSFGSVLLLLYYIPVTLIVHSFWNDADEVTRRMQGILFMKNLAIIGGLLMVVCQWKW